MGTYPPHRSSSRANNHEAVGGAGESNASRFAAAGGATLSRLHMMQQQGPQAQEAIKRQTMSARGLSDKEFTKHCRGFDVQIKVRKITFQTLFCIVVNSDFLLLQGLNNKFTSIKNQVSDLHRDVTTRRCLTSYKQVENIVMDCASLTDEIEQTDQLMRERKELFHKMWEEEQQRITIEQTIFKEQVYYRPSRSPLEMEAIHWACLNPKKWPVILLWMIVDFRETFRENSHYLMMRKPKEYFLKKGRKCS